MMRKKPVPLPAELKKGDPLSLRKLSPSQHFTKPPAHYTEASLVKELESLGIGRPSTYAQIINTIQEREYVQREKKNLLATDLGKDVIQAPCPRLPRTLHVWILPRTWKRNWIRWNRARMTGCTW